MKAFFTFFVLCACLWQHGSAQTANFTASTTQGCAPLTVNFSNTSTGAVSYLWDFDNGLTSTQTNPSHTFYGYGRSYAVTLYAYDASSNVDSFSVVINVPGNTPYFSLPAQSCPGKVLNFSVSGNYDSDNIVEWDFGDGFSGNGTFAQHAYSDTGQYWVYMTVTNSACGTVTDSNQITITNTVVPTIHIHPEYASTTICPGENFPFFYDEDLSILWEFGDGNSSSDPYPVYSYSSAGTYTATITVTNECGNTASLDTIITVSDAAVPDAGFYLNKQKVCPGDIFSAYGKPGFGYTYSWSINGSVTAAGQVLTHSFNQLGVQNIELEVTNVCGNTDVATGSITVTDTLIPSGWLQIKRKNICPGTPAEFFAPNGHSSYLWKFGDSDSSNVRSPAHIYSNAGTYPVKLTLTNGCGNSISYYDTIVVDSSAKPVAAFNFPQSGFCQGDQIQFNYTGTNDVVNYAWDFGDGNSDTLKHPLYSYADTGNYSVMLIVENICGNTDTAMRPLVIDTGISSHVNFTYAPYAAVCPGNLLSFVNLSSDTSACLWDFGDGGTSSLANPTHQFASAGNYLVKLSITNSCGKTSLVSKLITVSAQNMPLAEINTGADETFCINEGGIFQNIAGNAFFDHVWSFGDGDSSSFSGVVHSFASAGTYSLILMVSNACGTSRDTSIITVTDTLPAAVMTCSSSADTVSVSWNSIAGADLYLISTDNGATWDSVPANQNSYHFGSAVPGDTVRFLLKAVQADGCGDGNTASLNCTVSGIRHNNQANDQFQIFPNPARGVITVAALEKSENEVTVTVLDQVGKQEKRVILKPGNEWQINVSGLSAGVYFVRISTKDILSIKRIVIF